METKLSDIAQKVKRQLIEKGIETPIKIDNHKDSSSKIKTIEFYCKGILEELGLDLNDDSLKESPRRIAKMYVEEIFSGLNYKNFPKITLIKNKLGSKEPICVSDISFTSTCEHHLITIDGMAEVKYIPKNNFIGLSKINRVVRFFSQRPQVQERLTEQIKEALQVILMTDSVSVKITARHYCVKARGVMDATSVTTTTAKGGLFL